MTKIDIVVAVAFRGGVEQVLNITASYLIKHGYDVRIIHMIWQGAEWAEPGIPFVYLADATKSVWKNDGEQLVQLYTEYLSENGVPDVILCAGWPALVPIARKAVMNVYGNTAVISWLHGGITDYEEMGFGGCEELKYADAHFAINDSLAEMCREKVCSGDVYRITNPVDMRRIVYSEERDIHSVAFVGRFSPEKNIPYLLKTMSVVPEEWTLHMVGDGDPEGNGMRALKKYCEELGVSDRVLFYGWQENPWKCLKHVGFLAITSDHEAAPLVINEALLCGMNVIATPTNGAVERIKPGVNGYLIEYDNPAFFAKLLIMIGNGQLPYISPAECRQSASHLVGDEVLADFADKIEEVIKRRKTTTISMSSNP